MDTNSYPEITRFNSWEGPGLIALSNSDGTSAFNLATTSNIQGARIINFGSPFSPPKVERAQLFVKDSNDNSTRVLDFELDGTNSGIAQFTADNSLTIDQIRALEVETGFDLNADSTAGLTVANELYNPNQNGGSYNNDSDRYVIATTDDQIALTRSSFTSGAVINTTNDWEKTVILSDENGAAIKASEINPTSANNIFGARTIIYQPDDWPVQEINYNSAFGFNLYVGNNDTISVSSALSTNTASNLGGVINNSVDVISFDQLGQEVKRSTLSGEGLLSAEVRENLDLNNDGLVGFTIEEQLFSPNGGGSDRRFVVSSTQGLIVSRDSVPVGSDLKNSNNGLISARPSTQLTTTGGNSAFEPNPTESIVEHGTYSSPDSNPFQYSSVVLYLKNSNTNSVRAAAFEYWSTVDSSTISGTSLINAEIRTSGDFNADNFVGAELGESLFTPTATNGSNNQRHVYNSDKGLILFRNTPHSTNIQSNSYDNNSWDGPSILAVDNQIQITRIDTITSARVTRTSVTAILMHQC